MDESPQLNISIDPNQIKELVSEAILAQLSSDQRTSIIGQAVKSLVTETRGDYGRTIPSPLSVAFSNAVAQSAQKIAAELVEEDPEFKEAVRNAVKDAMSAAMKDSYKLTEAVTETVVKVILDGARY